VTPFIDPDMLPILEEMRSAPPVDYASMPISEARKIFDTGAAYWRALSPRDVVVDELTIPGAAGPMRARLYRPDAAATLPLILYVHGGGWTFGSVDSHENEMRYLALSAQAAVLGFDYRLAPEAAFPAPLDDLLAAIEAVQALALAGKADASRWAIAGDSAGAHLALAAMLSRRDAGAALPSAAGLFYGCYAPRFDNESNELFGSADFGLSNTRMRWYWANLLGGATPDALSAPLDADFTGLPPAYLLAAGLDPLRDDTLQLAARFAAAGVPHELLTVPGVIHGFLGRAPRLPAAQRALRGAGAFLSTKLNGRTSNGT
jgi:acetyl esterase